MVGDGGNAGVESSLIRRQRLARQNAAPAIDAKLAGIQKIKKKNNKNGK